MSKRITEAWLRRHHACADQRERFAQEWPEGAELTAANIRRAAALGLDLGWFACEYLDGSAWRAYREAIATVLIDALGLKEEVPA